MGSGSGACVWSVLMKCFSWASKYTAVGGGRKCQIRDARGLLGSLSGVNRTPGGPVGLISTSCTLLDPSNRSWFELFSRICQIPPIIGCIQYKIMKTPINKGFLGPVGQNSPSRYPKIQKKLKNMVKIGYFSLRQNGRFLTKNGVSKKKSKKAQKIDEKGRLWTQFRRKYVA